MNKAYEAKSNKVRKGIEYQLRDLIWLHLKKERFPTRRKSKLILRRDRPFKVLTKGGTNDYRLELPGDVAVSTTSNLGDLSPYVEDDINFGI